MRIFLRDAGGSEGRGRRRLRAGERPSVYREHDGPLVGNDVRHGRDWQQTPTPDKDAVMTDRDSVTAGEFDKRPDARSLPVEYRVSLRRREHYSNPPRIAPSRHCDKGTARPPTISTPPTAGLPAWPPGAPLETQTTASNHSHCSGRSAEPSHFGGKATSLR